MLNELSLLELSIARLGGVNESQAIQTHIQVLDKANYQNQIWATRKRPWIDHLASAWRIKSFIDATPTLIWLETPTDCPEEALGFDFDSARFSHVNHWGTFEVLLHSFSLETTRTQNIAEIVHLLDVVRIEPPEAIGIEKIMQGLRSQISNDEQLFELSNHIFDGL